MKDLTGQRFGKLTALKFEGRDSRGYAVWICKCDCGQEVAISSAKLLRPPTSVIRSCGECGPKKDSNRGRKRS